jgi:hypothetical protein
MKASLAACAAAAVFLAACAENPTTKSVIDPQMSSLTSGNLRVTVNGPDGTNLCNILPDSALIRIRVIDRAPNPDVFRRGKTVMCPLNTDTFANLAFGPDYILQAALLTPGGSEARVPSSFINPTPFEFSADGTRKIIRVLLGAPIGGIATVDGRNAAGVGLTIQPTISNYFAAGQTFTSDNQGAWRSSFGAAPFLQRGLSYTATCSGGLGLSTGPAPVGPFVFNTDLSDINCALSNSLSKRWSHTATDLVFTAWDGHWGAVVHGPDTVGLGWGLQYPVATRPSRAQEASHSFFGGLIFSVNSSLVSAADLQGYNLECGANCRDMSWGVLSLGKSGEFGRRVTWDMSDAGFTDGRGLSIKQTSYDGEGGDFILFKLELTNNNASSMRVYAGMYNDWDVWGANGENPAGNIGGMNGNIAYVGNGATGPYVGTVFFGNYTTRGNRFVGLSTTPITLAEQVETLQGLRNNTSAGPQDLRTFHSVGPIGIGAGGRKIVWFAIVAGTTQAELAVNASAAQAHYEALAGIAPSLVESGETVFNAASARVRAPVTKSF